MERAPSLQAWSGDDDVVRIGTVAAVLGVRLETLRAWEREGRIAFSRRRGQRVVTHDELDRLIDGPENHRRWQSRNRLEGVVEAVTIEGVMARVELRCGPFRVTCSMSREAAEALDLRPGAEATAVLDAIGVIVEPSSFGRAGGP